jgi:Protein of unknown function (DUF1570)
MKSLLLLAILASLSVAFATTAPSQGTANLRDIRRGPWKQGYKIPKGWVVYKTRFYEVQSQAGKEKAIRLGKHMESMLRVYVKRFRPTKTLSTKKYAIKLLKSRAAFRAYGAPPGAGAYYSGRDKEMVCYDTGKWFDDPKKPGPITGPSQDDDPLAALKARMDRWKMDILGAASHEGWHQYFAWYVGSQVQLPSWINEGMGDYFYTARPRKVRGRKMPAKLGRLNPTRLGTIQAAIKRGRHVPIKEILTYDQRQYYSNPSVCYAEGWALCQFLLHSGNKRYERIVPRFIRLVDTDTNMPAVTKKAFHRIDLDKLEKEWKAWVLAQKLPEDKASDKAKKPGN